MGPDLGRYTANDKENKPDYVAILLSLEPLIFFMIFPIGQLFVPAELKDWIIPIIGIPLCFSIRRLHSRGATIRDHSW